MNQFVSRMYNAIQVYANKWHSENRTLFDFDEKIHNEMELIAVKLLYHNYQIWHFIELYTDPDSNTVLFVYDGGIRHNKERNYAIEALDSCLCELQKGTGKINSETLGSVMDRIGILYIKLLHLEDKKDPRTPVIQYQLDRLLKCASELMDDMISGERQCEMFSRFKIEYSGQ